MGIRVIAADRRDNESYFGRPHGNRSGGAYFRRTFPILNAFAELNIVADIASVQPLLRIASGGSAPAILPASVLVQCEPSKWTRWTCSS